MDLDIKIYPDLLQIHLRSAHRYPNSIQIHFKPIQIRSDWIWITWILDQIQSIAIPNVYFSNILTHHVIHSRLKKCRTISTTDLIHLRHF